jgi:hypothetical protein
MRIPNDQTITIEWKPTWIGYLEGVLFIFQSITTIFSFCLVFLWVILGIVCAIGIFKIPILFIVWIIGSIAWIAFASIAWRELTSMKPNDFQFREKIKIWIGVFLNTALTSQVFMFLNASQNTKSIIFGFFIIFTLFNAPTLTILFIFLRKKLYQHFSNKLTPPDAIIEHDYSKPQQGDKLSSKATASHLS